ncbi:MAG: ATP-binding protein [Aquificae bacterium]|nr:ATP-binding protein [Aquificota bacterium]
MAIFREESNLGRLMFMQPDPNTQYIAYIWFDYNLHLMKSLQEGDFVAIQSFSSDSFKDHYVILQIVKKMPHHFALPTDLKGYPGFLMEAAKSASQDWITQVDSSTEDTTKIVCEAIPINMGFYWENSEEDTIKSLKEDFSLPMPGKEVKILSYEFMEKILNKGMNPNSLGITEIGYLQHNENIKILLNIENLIRMHFGIFGFTGAGKSNLISTLISKIMENSPEGTKIVIFDIMGEYLTLLIDMLIKYPKSKIIGIGRGTFVEDLYKYYNNERTLKPDVERISLLNKAVKTILNTNLYPKRLLPHKQKFVEPIKKLIERRAFMVYEAIRNKTIDDIFIEAGLESINIASGDKERIENILKKYSGKPAYKVADLVLRDIEALKSNKSNTAKFKNQLKRLLRQPFITIHDENIFISIEEIISELNSKYKAIYIIQSHDPDELKKFVHELSSSLYEDRRNTGRILPLVSFILDEADEFIPQDVYAKGESKTSRQAVEMLARRGRKFGIGVGIATQRVVYLDTNIMAQPHTYFISKLPRVSDRERISEAFAMSGNTFEQTFRFRKGDWLLVSHDATGLEAIPFPIHTDNAEERIIKFLLNYQS